MTIVPRADPLKDSPYEVFHRVDTGDFYLAIFDSNSGAPIVFESSGKKAVLRFLPRKRMLEKPNAKSIFLSSLMRSTRANHKVFKAD